MGTLAPGILLHAPKIRICIGQWKVCKIRIYPNRKYPTHARTAQKISLLIPASKTHQRGEGKRRSSFRSGHPIICLVMAGAILMRVAGNANSRPKDPVGKYAKSGAMVTYQSIASDHKKGASTLGLNVSSISCHSLRGRGASAMLQAGIFR
jgi:hypothetical protein